MPGRPNSRLWNFTARILPASGIGHLSFVIRHWFLVIGVWSLVLTSPVSAKVFWRGTGGETGGVIAADPAWSRGYASMVRINGGRAGVELWSAGLSLEETVEALRARLMQNGATVWFTGSGEMVWAIACDGDRVYRFLISAGFGPRSCHVFQISQTFAEFKASLEPPKTHLLKHAPEFPGSTPTTFLASETTRTEMAGSASPAAPEDVQQFYSARLRDAGWAAPLPANRSATLYIRGNEAILVSTQTAGESGGCQIMLLHKPLAVTEGK